MITLRDIMGPDADARDPETRKQATERLQQAYQATFSGNGSREDADLVTEDLLRYSGFHTITPAVNSDGEQVPDAVLRQNEGMRQLMGRILWMTDVNIAALRQMSVQAAKPPLAD